jgi:RimJ/RimL family protein N-acetyltransferase
MNIVGKKVFLRAIEEDDLSTLHKWANLQEICYMLGGWHLHGSMVSVKKWFDSLQDDPLNQRFAVEAPDSGLIGTANLINIDWKNRHATHGLMLGDQKNRGKGDSIDIMMAVMRYAFDRLQLERLKSSIFHFCYSIDHKYDFFS